jgi:hypothetical protein
MRVFRFPLSALRFPHSAFRIPLSAFRFALLGISLFVSRLRHGGFRIADGRKAAVRP